MSPSTTLLQVADAAMLPRVRERLLELYRPVMAPPETLTRLFYDTFDWAVFHDGGALEWRSGRDTRRLIRSDLDGGSAPLSQALADPPGFAFELPLGPVRERLVAICGPRRLLPLVEIESHITGFRLVNDQAEILVRVEIDEASARRPGGDPCRVLGPRICLFAEPHHAHVAREVAGILVEELGLEVVAAPMLLEALAACGRSPGDYSSKIEETLDPEQRADTALKQVLGGLLATLLANLEGTREDLDSEFLHDLRVATRRTRSALGQIKGVFPPDSVVGFQERFAWLQRATGPVRDLDVYLQEFERYREAIPGRLRAGLDPARAYLAGRRAIERRRLIEALDSPEFRDLVRDWRGFLDAPVAEHPAEPNATRPIKAVADERIWRLVKRVRREGLAIHADSPATELHELRKSCKKLRYLMELFQSLYPRGKMTRLIKVLKALLDDLGSIQDLAVQAEHLMQWASEMQAEGATDSAVLLSMGALVGQLLARQGQARDDFSEVFRVYLQDDHQALFRTLCGPP